MKTLSIAYRVTDLDRLLDFYTALLLSLTTGRCAQAAAQVAETAEASPTG